MIGLKHKSQRTRHRKLQKKVDPVTSGPLINSLFGMNRHDRRAWMSQYRANLRRQEYEARFESSELANLVEESKKR